MSVAGATASVESAPAAQRNGFTDSAANAAAICSMRRREMRDGSNMGSSSLSDEARCCETVVRLRLTRGWLRIAQTGGNDKGPDLCARGQEQAKAAISHSRSGHAQYDGDVSDGGLTSEAASKKLPWCSALGADPFACSNLISVEPRTRRISFMPLPTDPKALTLSRDLLQAFDNVNGGEHQGFRPAHAKGVMLTGTFHPSADAASLSRAPHLRGKTPVAVRFSDFAGIPTIP